MAVIIGIEYPLSDEFRALIAELNAALHVLTPPEHCYHLTVEQMAEPDTTVFIARENERAIACGALKRHANAIGEVKRMYTRPAWQGRGIGGRIVAEIEKLARAERLCRLVLRDILPALAARRNRASLFCSSSSAFLRSVMFATMPTRMIFWIPRCVSWASRSVLAKPLCAQCSSTTTSASRGPNSGWNSPPQLPTAKP